MNQFKAAICKLWHWNLGIGIGIGIGAISTSIRPVKPKPSRMRLKMRGHKPQTYLTHWPWGRKTKQKRHISVFTMLMASKIWHGADSEWRGTTQNITLHIDPVVVTWQFKNVIFPQPQAVWPPNLARWVLRLKNRHVQRNGFISWSRYKDVISLLSYSLWSVVRQRMKEQHLKIYNFSLPVSPQFINQLVYKSMYFVYLFFCKSLVV